MKKVFLAIAMLAALVAQPALAQTAAPAALDLGPLVSLAAEYLAEVVVVALVWVYGRFAAGAVREHLGEQADAAARDGLDRIARLGIRLGLEKVAGSDTLSEVEIRNAIVREAASYVVTSAPGWVARFKLTPERVAEMVRARLPGEVEAALAESETALARLATE